MLILNHVSEEWIVPEIFLLKIIILFRPEFIKYISISVKLTLTNCFSVFGHGSYLE